MQTLVKLELWEIKKILKSLSTLFIFFISIHSPHAYPYVISSDLLDIKNRGEFLSHEEWLGISFPMKELMSLKRQIEEKTQTKLFALPDSYLMLITSQEWALLKSSLKMSEIEKVFLKEKLNQVKLEPYCLAHYKGKVGDQSYTQWALILKENKKLNDFRHDVRRLFRFRGGFGDDFQVDRWKPLLVVGFTSREFFDQDGLIKSNQAECIHKF